MAEFCLDCWNKMNGTNHDAKKYIISKELWLCEGCTEWKPVIIAERKYYYRHKFRFIIFPFELFGKIIYLLWRILILPYLLCRYYQAKKQNNKK